MEPIINTENFNYTSLIKRATGILNKHNINNIEAGDLVSETLLKYGFKDENVFARQMFIYAGSLKENSYKKDDVKFHHDRVCRKCKENKPSICFRSWRLRGYLIFDSYCTICKNFIINEYKKKKRAERKAEINNVQPGDEVQCGVGKNNI